MTIDTTYLDSGADKIKLARPAILAMAQEINLITPKLGEIISPTDAGISPANPAATNTTAFGVLETSHPGEPIDLLGKQYAVSAIPTGCQYFNGDFIIGSTRVSLRRNPLDNPLDGNSWIAFGDGLTHYWLFGFVYIEATGKMLAFVKPAYRHATSDSSPLNVITSDDRGATWKDERTIHSVAGFDISHAACSIMGSGRIGVVAYVKDLDTAAYRNDFIYSDDSGATWTAATDIVSGLSVFTYGDILPYPASAGGSDTAGFAVYGYVSGARIAKTVDNGATWTSATIAGVGSQFAEPSVVRVNGANQWLMFLRDDGANLFVSTSTNMTTWTTPVDTGYALGSNPVYAFVDGGRLFVYCFIRDYFSTAGGVENQLICFEESPTAVYAASNLVNKAPRAISDGIERSVGYLCVRKVGQDFVWGYTAGEYSGSTNSAAASSVVFGSTRRVPAVGAGFVQSAIANPNLLRNPTFEFWSRGTSFAGISATTKTADGWAFNPSGATATISRSELTAEESILFPFNPHYAYSFVTSVSNDYAGMYQDFFGKEELFRFSEQQVTIQVWGIGDLPRTTSPNLPRVSVTLNYGSGGSTTVAIAEALSFVESTGNIWKATATVTAPTTLGKTIGTAPYVRIQFDSQANAAWNAKICGIKAEFGQYASRFDPVDYQRDRMLCDRYVQRLEMPGIDSGSMIAGQTTTAGFGVMPFPEMISDPVISIISGAASDFEIYPGAAAISAMTWSNIGRRAAVVNVTTTGLSVAGSYMVRSKTGATPALLFDAE